LAAQGGMRLALGRIVDNGNDAVDRRRNDFLGLEDQYDAESRIHALAE